MQPVMMLDPWTSNTLAVADFDCDGKPDLLMQMNGSFPQLGFWSMDGVAPRTFVRITKSDATLCHFRRFRF